MSRKRPRLVLGQHAGDVVVDDDHLVDMAHPLRREDADGGRAAADAHALLGDAVDDRAACRPAPPPSRRRRSPARRPRRLQSSSSASQVTTPSFLLPPVRWCTPPERQHLRAVLGRGDVADLLALHAHRRLLGAEIAVGVDLHLHAAVAEDALGHDRDHVDAVVLGRHDEGRRLVVGIGGGGADAGDEGALALPSSPAQAALPSTKATRARSGLASSTSGSTRTSLPSSLA